jgi:hypothetical protein
MLAVFLFPIWFFWASLFTRIYSSGGTGAVTKLRSAEGMQQWWRQKDKELVNSKQPHYPPYKAS